MYFVSWAAIVTPPRRHRHGLHRVHDWKFEAEAAKVSGLAKILFRRRRGGGCIQTVHEVARTSRQDAGLQQGKSPYPDAPRLTLVRTPDPDLEPRHGGLEAISRLMGVRTSERESHIGAYGNAKRGTEGAAFPGSFERTKYQPAACAGRSRWCFMTILLSAPR